MKRDLSQKRLENYNDVFADIFDNILFCGHKVLKAEELVSIPTESFMRGMQGQLRQGCRDICKKDGKNGSYRLICGIENQAGLCKKDS